MRARWLGPLVALALPAAAAAQEPPPPPPPSPQAVFETAIVDDPATTATVRELLRTDAAFVTTRPLFAELTGDGRVDAVVSVQTPGAAGTVAMYVLTSHGNAEGALRVVLRSQKLYRGRARVSRGTLTISQPRWARGDDLCCPAARADRDYVWDARRERLRRHGAERVIQLRD